MSRQKRQAVMRVAVCAAIGASAGCVKIEYVHSNTSEKVVDSTTVSEQTTQPVADHAGTPEAQSIRVLTKCDVYRVDSVVITNEEDAKNRSTGTTWALIGTGAATAAIGAWALADARNVYDNDPTQRTYNLWGQAAARGAGAATLVGGLTIAAVGVVGAGRATATRRSETDTERRYLDEAETCEGTPIGGVKMAVRYEKKPVAGREVSIGTTANDGAFVFRPEDLELPNSQCALEDKPFGATVVLLANGTPVGSVDIAPAYERWIFDQRSDEHELTERARHEAESCRTTGNCEALQEYFETNLCWSDREADLNDALDDGMWVQATRNPCTTATEPATCTGARSYLSKFPSGRHAAQAEGVLAAAHEAGVRGFRALDQWAARSIDANWSSRLVTESTCRNRVGVEVACDSAAAWKKDDVTSKVDVVSVTNRSSVKLTCGIEASKFTLGGLRQASGNVVIPPGGQESLTSVENGLLMLFGMANARWVFCATEAEKLAAYVPEARALLSGGTGAFGAGIVNAGGQTRRVLALPNEKFYVWDGTDANEVEASK